MKLLWANGECTVSQLVSALADDTAWNKNTVFTMVKRLCEKNAVIMSDEKIPQKYKAVITREKAAEEETRSFISRVYDGSVQMLVSSLSGQCELSKSEIDELRAILDKAEREHKEKGD